MKIDDDSEPISNPAKSMYHHLDLKIARRKCEMDYVKKYITLLQDHCKNSDAMLEMLEYKVKYSELYYAKLIEGFEKKLKKMSGEGGDCNKSDEKQNDEDDRELSNEAVGLLSELKQLCNPYNLKKRVVEEIDFTSKADIEILNAAKVPGESLEELQNSTIAQAIERDSQEANKMDHQLF